MTLLAELQLLDTGFLTGLVRQDQRNPHLEILEWTVEPLHHASIITTTGGLFLFSGQGSDSQGFVPWAIVLKVVHAPDRVEEPNLWRYWKREVMAYESGLLAALPRSIVAPRCYDVTERADGAWIWMEHIVESVQRRWTLQNFQHVARQMGCFGGAYLTGTPLPDHPWLSGPFFRSLLVNSGWPYRMNPTSPDSCWSSPVVQTAFSDALRKRVLRIWADKHIFWDAIDQLPQVLCHNDLHRRNLMLRADPNGQSDGQETVVVVDWALCGRGAIGADIGELVGSSLYFFEADVAQATALEAAAFEGYVAGLSDAGWSGDVQQVRLGYTSSVTLWLGAILPGWVPYLFEKLNDAEMEAMFGRSREEVLAGWVMLTEFALDRADEARHLIDILGLKGSAAWSS